MALERRLRSTLRQGAKRRVPVAREDIERDMTLEGKPRRPGQDIYRNDVAPSFYPAMSGVGRINAA
jgi:hypothetical protein